MNDPVLTLTRPWLAMDLPQEAQVLSWALNRPGFVQAQRILWREVRNADLTPDLDVGEWLNQELAMRHDQQAVTLLTSRDIRAYETAAATVGDYRAYCVATVGLSNAERIGTRLDRSGHDWGTINIAVHVQGGAGLSQAGLIETLSIATQARTSAVMDIGYKLPTGVATGTGTDCIAVAAAPGKQAFCGLHTDIGEAVGRAVYDAVHAGAADWMVKVRRPEGWSDPS